VPLDRRGSRTKEKKVERTQKSSQEDMKEKETVQAVAKVTSNQQS
jgi:hypothetical protein